MTWGVAALVGLGIVAVILIGVGGGFDTGSFIIIAFIAAFGVLAVAVTKKARSGVVSPKRCESCSGLISPNAPYCKHCGAPAA
jgi:hypothetical protein